MAVTARASGSWAGYTASGTVAIPAGATSGDRMFLLATWKDESVTGTVAGWTEIGEFADGTTGSGNGTGSMRVKAWYKDHSGSESDPTLTLSGSPILAAAVIQVFTKGAGDAWSTPVWLANGFNSGAAAWSTTDGAGAAMPSTGGVAIAFVGVRDDSSTFTRSTTSITNGGATFNGNYVEYPVSHWSTTTGQDMSADAGYRLVTSHNTVASVWGLEGTNSAAETGACAWVLQGITASGTLYTQTLNASLSFTGSRVSQTRKTLSASMTPAGSISKNSARVFNASITPAGALVKRTARTLAGGLTPSGSLVSSRVVVKVLNAALTFSGAVTKRANRTFAAGFTPQGALSRQTQKVLAGAAGFVGGLTKRTSRSLAASISPSGTLVKRVNRGFSAALTFVGNLATSYIPPGGTLFTKSFSAALGLSGSISRRTSRSFAAVLAPTGSVAKQTRRSYAATLGLSGSFSRIIAQTYYKVFNASVSLSGSLLAGSLRVAVDALQQWAPRVRWPYRNGLPPRR